MVFFVIKEILNEFGAGESIVGGRYGVEGVE